LGLESNIGPKYAEATFLLKQSLSEDVSTLSGPNLGSHVHHVSVPGSVADMHNLNKIDIKNHTFIANGENMLQGSYLHSLGH
jgi:hypothetical protein